jgi:soluble cytochrome b562
MPIRAPLVLLLLSLALASCGGGDSASKEDFAQEANRICRDTEKELEGLDTGSREELVDTIDKVIKTSRQASDGLLDIERPDGEDGETATKFVEGFEKELDDKLVPALEELKKAVKDNDPKAAQEAAAQLQKLENTDSDRYARELGARACVG